MATSLILPDTITPRDWGIWADLVNRYNRFETPNLEDLAHMALKLQQSRIWNPVGLAGLDKDEIFAHSDALGNGGHASPLWQAARCFNEHKQPGQIHLRLDLINMDIDKMLRKFQKRKIPDTEIYKEYGRMWRSIELPGNLDDLAPLLRKKALARSSAMGRDIGTFSKSAERTNVSRSTQGPLKSVASGIRNYVRFCALLGMEPFPPTETTVRSWGALFKPGRTFKNYLAHLKKACFPLEVDTRWDTPAVRTIAQGIENAHGRSFGFPNFRFPNDLIAICGRDGLHSPFSQLAFRSYLFSLLVPSEAIQIRRAYADDAPHGVRTPTGQSPYGYPDLQGP